MKSVSLSGSLRENVGKKDASTLRQQGKVPCVLYGGESQIHFSVNYLDISKIVFSPDVYFVDINLEKDNFRGAIKDLQFDPLTDKVTHVDFMQLFEDKEVKLELPVQISGSSIGVRNGGKLAVHFRRLPVRGLPKDFPDAVEINISKLRIGQAIRIKSIQFPGITVIQNPEAVIVAVKRGRASVEDEAEEEAGAEGEAPATAEAPAAEA
jgi:large subunit ribosomal protein L25